MKHERINAGMHALTNGIAGSLVVSPDANWSELNDALPTWKSLLPRNPFKRLVSTAVTSTLLLTSCDVDGQASTQSLNTQPPQSSIQIQPSQGRSNAEYFGVPTSEVRVLPIPTALPPRAPQTVAPLATPSRIEPPRPTLPPSPSPISTLRPGISEPKPSPMPTVRPRPTEGPLIISDTRTVEGPLTKTANSRRGVQLDEPRELSTIEGEADLIRKVDEASDSLPMDMSKGLQTLLRDTATNAVMRRRVMTLGMPKTFQIGDGDYSIEATVIPGVAQEVVIENVDLGTNIKLNVYRNPDGAYKMEASIFTRKAVDGLEYVDKGLNALPNTLAMLQILMDQNPELKPGLREFNALWPGYTSEDHGVRSNEGRFMATMNRLGANGLNPRSNDYDQQLANMEWL